MSKRDRPKDAETAPMRTYIVKLKDGTGLIGEAQYRSSARHCSRSWRSDYVSSKQHYSEIVSCRLA